MMIRRIPRPPPEFAEEFARGGWERVELLYGARTDCNRKWIHITNAKARNPRPPKPKNAALVAAVSKRRRGKVRTEHGTDT